MELELELVGAGLGAGLGLGLGGELGGGMGLLELIGIVREKRPWHDGDDSFILRGYGRSCMGEGGVTSLLQHKRRF